jgi:hypothetical protein
VNLLLRVHNETCVFSIKTTQCCHCPVLPCPALSCSAQVDLDLGNYERFLDITLTRDNNITTGKIYQVCVGDRLTWQTWLRAGGAGLSGQLSS